MMNGKRMMTWKTVLLGAAVFGVGHGAAWAKQECNLNFSETTPTNRFKIDTRIGVVYDIETKLTWKICAEGMTYSNARCTGNPINLNWNVAMKTYGRDGQGWRLPNIDELRSIVEKRCSNPPINLNVFPDTPMFNFWSSSDAVGWVDRAFDIKFEEIIINYGYSGDPSSKLNNYHVRLVRVGQLQKKEADEQYSQLQNYQNVLNGRNPRAMYLLAAELIEKGQRDKAKDLYRQIMKEFRNDDLAIKAADQLNRLQTR